MTKKSTEEVRRQLSDILSRVAFGAERVVVTRNRKVIAAIVSPEDLRRLQEVEEAIEDRHDADVVRKVRAEGGRARPWEEVRAELDRIHGLDRAEGGARPKKPAAKRLRARARKDRGSRR